MVQVTDGEITDEWETLVNPEDRFSSRIKSIHGITEEMVRDAPTMPEIGRELGDRLNGKILVSHSPFDRTALTQAMWKYRLSPPRVYWRDSCKVARYAWPYLRNHKLKTVADFLGFEFKHHDALEDARIVGKIFLHAQEGGVIRAHR